MLKSIIFLMPSEIGFFMDLFDFWSQNGAKLAPKSNQKSISTSKSDFVKIVREHDFRGSGGRSWDPKSIKNRSKNGIENGRHLGIDFWSILRGLGWQVGAKNRSKIDPESNQKKDAKKYAKKWKNRLGRGCEATRAHGGRTPGSTP